MSVTGPDALVSAGPVCGLLVDAWIDMVPGRTQPTGIAVHFDAPAARPPQAILLGLAEPGERWSMHHARRLVLDTLDLAKARAVGPSRLEAFRHVLPAAYLPDTAAVSGGEAGAAG